MMSISVSLHVASLPVRYGTSEGAHGPSNGLLSFASKSLLPDGHRLSSGS